MVKTQVPVELGVYVLGYLRHHHRYLNSFIKLIHHQTIKENIRKPEKYLVWGLGVLILQFYEHHYQAFHYQWPSGWKPF